MFGELFEGLDGFEEGSLIYSHLQDACDMCHGVYCPWRETEGSKHPTRPGRGGRVKCSCCSGDQSSFLECVWRKAIRMPLKGGRIW